MRFVARLFGIAVFQAMTNTLIWSRAAAAATKSFGCWRRKKPMDEASGRQPLSPAALADFIDSMAENPKGGKMAAIAYNVSSGRRRTGDVREIHSAEDRRTQAVATADIGT
jgi:hypothetical protein